MCNSVSFFLLFNDMSDQISKISTSHIVCSEVNRQYGKLRSEQIILISVKLLPLQMSRLFACIIMHDGLVAGIDASNPFFLSLKNSILDCFQMELIYFLLQQPTILCKKLHSIRTYPEMKR